MTEDELLIRLHEVFNPKGSQNNFGPDVRVAGALGILVEAVVRLDKTSRRLAVVSIVLTGVILAVGIVQIGLMLRGH
jgi:hypothetical protein